MGATGSNTSLQIGESLTYKVDIDLGFIPKEEPFTVTIDINTNHPDTGDGCINSIGLPDCAAEPGPSALHVCKSQMSTDPGGNVEHTTSTQSRWFDVAENKVLCHLQIN